MPTDCAESSQPLEKRVASMPKAFVARRRAELSDAASATDDAQTFEALRTWEPAAHESLADSPRRYPRQNGRAPGGARVRLVAGALPITRRAPRSRSREAPVGALLRHGARLPARRRRSAPRSRATQAARAQSRGRQSPKCAVRGEGARRARRRRERRRRQGGARGRARPRAPRRLFDRDEKPRAVRQRARRALQGSAPRRRPRRRAASRASTSRRVAELREAAAAEPPLTRRACARQASRCASCRGRPARGGRANRRWRGRDTSAATATRRRSRSRSVAV